VTAVAGRNLNQPTNTMNNLITKSGTQNILLTATNADNSIRTQSYYWTAEEAISAACRIGGFYTIRNVETGVLIEAQW